MTTKLLSEIAPPHDRKEFLLLTRELVAANVGKLSVYYSNPPELLGVVDVGGEHDATMTVGAIVVSLRSGCALYSTYEWAINPPENSAGQQG